MSTYILFPTFAFFVSFFTWTYIFAQQKRDPVNTTFLLFAANNMGWIIGDLAMYLPFIEPYQMQVARIGTLFWLPCGFWFLVFAYALLGRKQDWVLRLAAGATAAATAFTIFTDHILIGFKKFDWGVAQIFHPIYHPLISILTAATAGYAVLLILRKRAVSTELHERRALGLLIWGAITVMAFIATINIVLPSMFGVYDFPMLGSSAFTVFVVLVFLAVTRYRFLSISVEKVAEELFEDLHEGVLLADRTGRVLRSNAAARAVFGTFPEGRDVHSLLFGHTEAGDFTNVVVCPRPDDPDSPFYALSASTVRRNDETLGKIYIICDITEQQRAENVLRRSKEDLEREVKERTRQLKHAQRMEAVGTLAGGIAHDFNNVLAVILGFANAAKHDLPKNNPVYSDIQEIIVAGNRGREIVRQILTISRKQDTSEFVTENLISIVRETAKLLQRSLPKNIVLRLEVPDTAVAVSCDTTQIAQVLMNLCNNAIYAMKDRPEGKLTIGVEQSTVNDETARTADLPSAGAYTRLYVQDTGCGMDEAQCAQIFNPFFTTKPQGEGTGLGLATAFVIVQNHDGDIQVHSELGTGTEFSILLPILQDEDSLAASSASKDSEPADSIVPKARERLLLVDDESQVRRMGTRVLTQLGYDVETAAGGEDALDLLDREDHGFALVLTDYNMPSMNGLQLAQNLRMRRNPIPIILMSGYGDKITPEEINEHGIAAFLTKPAQKKVLDAAIRQTLENRNA